jgi:HEAT repeat protein
MGLCVTASGFAQRTASDPVEELQRLMREQPLAFQATDKSVAKRLENLPPQDRVKFLLEEREKMLAGHIRALRNLADMCRALELQVWPSEQDREERAVGDARNRALLAKQTEHAFRRVLQSGDRSSRLAALTLLGEMGAQMPGAVRGERFASALAPDVTALSADQDREVRVAAVRALSKITLDPKRIVATLATLVKGTDLLERKAAAEALAQCVRTVSDPQPLGSTDHPTFKQQLAMAEGVLPVAGAGVNDTDAVVRRLCIEAIQRAAQALGRVMPPLAERGQGLDRDKEMLAEFSPVLHTLGKQVPGLARALKDSELPVALSANQALEAVAEARLRFLLVAEDAYRRGLVPAAPLDILAPELRQAVEPLTKELSHKDVQIRLASLYVLETLGAEAAPAAGAIAKVLSDDDPFVRWAAARTIAAMAPLHADKFVAELARRLNDENGDVRETTLIVLARYGPAAKAAVPGLHLAANHRDTDTRVLVLDALAAIGKDAAVAAPEVITALSAPERLVRMAAARALGKMSPLAPPSVAALQRALADSDAHVRRAAADALLSDNH